METRLLRFAYIAEFLLAEAAIFIAWSEIGGQAALDIMHWGWKFGFGILLGAAIVALTAALLQSESLWTLNSLRWITAIFVLIAGMIVVTYFYSQQVDNGQSDETGTISLLK